LSDSWVIEGGILLRRASSLAGTNAITVAASGVTLDLNGFTISCTLGESTGAAIWLNSGMRDVSIHNGHIQGSVTNNGGGVYGGNGFAYGISYSNNWPLNVLVSHVSVSGCLHDGISLIKGESSVVEGCTVHTVGGNGIVASTIKQSTAMDCGNSAINGNQVSDSQGQCSGNGYGIYAATAQNCSGFCDGSGTGLYANTATGCSGESFTGTGLSAYIANCCTGLTDFGTALSVTHNVNSF
jgi:hypothetical protein